ncbi:MULTISPECIES: response regulator [Paenibacillus]|jgi:two-component system response regulator YesN|uniref:DNA-binding response regulator n=1 Tax=Paenibacillus agaridevorans TaxID=171404 RepID=A0A2R5ENP4_9BACL|nr:MULTISPECIES: response regulator [Paenibacillus]QNK55747.1 response regulator [Paenibacillus sp. PAMC21692]GBG08282.1 DNA-binding response regulator [Paenibacillus agaridevorans]
MLNLMIVDDEPFMLKGLINIIEKGQTPCSEIVSANDGFDALEKLENYRPDLLITDIQMPEMNGLELIRKARERGLCNRFIILTGYDDPAYLHQAIRCKVIDYLLKPINKAELYDVMSNISLELLAAEDEAGSPSQADQDHNVPGVDYDQMSRNVKKIIRHIESHYKENISLDHIAEHVYLHPNYISSLFRKETGLTLIHYLHLFRIKKAKTLMLGDSEDSLHRISEQVGYESVRHFFSVFKKYCGVTPSEYRQHYKMNESLSSRK